MLSLLSSNQKMKPDFRPFVAQTPLPPPKKLSTKLPTFQRPVSHNFKILHLGSADTVVSTSQFHTSGMFSLRTAEKVYIWVCLHLHMFPWSYITIHPVVVQMKHTGRESETLPALHTFMLSTSCKASGWNGENINVYHLCYCTLTANKVAIQNLHTPTKHYTLECLNKQRIKKYETKATHWNSVHWFCSSTLDTAFTYNFIKLQQLKPFITLFYIYCRLLTYSMVQSPSWEANWFAASQEIPRILWNPKVHYHTHKRFNFPSAMMAS